MPKPVPRYEQPYHYWKFYEAVRSLAVSAAPIRTRVENARSVYGTVRRQDLPPELLETFDAIDERLAGASNGSWEDALAAMSEEQAAEVAELILTLFLDTAVPAGEE